MEFDTPKKPENAHEHKETKKKKLKKRTPAHVPLPLAEQTEKPVEKKVDLEKRPKNKVLKAREAEKPAEESSERPKVSLEKTQKPKEERTEREISPEASSEAGHDQEVSPSLAKLEEEVPLHVAAEGEVFISERLRQPAEESESEPAEAQHASETEPTRAPLETEGETTPVRPRGSMQRNPQQQQQTGPASRPAAASTGAGATPFLAQWRNRNTGGTPPHNPNIPPVPPFNPDAHPLYADALPPSPNVLPITSQPVAEQVRDRASERRHLVTGLVVGALVEHVRHKRREKRMNKAHKKEVKELGKEQDATNLGRRVEQNKQLREKTALEKTIARLEKVAIPFAAVAANKTPESVTAKPAAIAEQAKPMPVKTAEEAKMEFEERARRAVEVAREPAEELEIPKEHRVENSSWHAIEVDKKTGRAVENSSIVYGEAFHQEQHQEQLRKEAADAAADSDETRAKYKQAKEVATPTYNYATQPSAANESSRSEKLRDKGADLAETASQALSKVQPVDALLWVILGVIVLVILKLL